MKKLTLTVIVALMAMTFVSCSKDYTAFIGTWGVEKIEYYNVDYAGNPIEASYSCFEYDPNSIDNGIQLIFRDDKSGEMRDSAIDTIYLYNEETGKYDIPLPCPDTTVVSIYTYSYDKSEQLLYMNMEYEHSLHTYKMAVSDLTSESFIYENQYDKDYVEKAYLKRISDEPMKSTKSTGKAPVRHPHHRPGSLFGER